MLIIASLLPPSDDRDFFSWGSIKFFRSFTPPTYLCPHVLKIVATFFFFFNQIYHHIVMVNIFAQWLLAVRDLGNKLHLVKNKDREGIKAGHTTVCICF